MQTFIVFIALTLAELASAVIPNETCKLNPYLGGKFTNPGAKLRFSWNGLDLADSLASENFTNYVSTLRAPDIPVVDITLSDVHVTRFENANYYQKLVRPNTLRWGFDEAQLEVSAGYKRKVKDQPVEATVAITSWLVSMETASAMLKDVEGRPSTTSTCNAKLGQTNVTVTGDTDLLLTEPIKRIMIDQIQRIFQQLLCAYSNSVMNVVNDKLKTFQSTVKLDGQNLILDYGLTENPKVVENDAAIEGLLKGNVYYRVPAVFPFYPPDIRHEAESANASSMVKFYLTDYVMNTMLHTLHKEKLLQISAIPKTVSVNAADHLSLSCSNETSTGASSTFCVGSVFSNFTDLDPDRYYVKAYLHATEAPKVIFEENEAYWIAQGVVGMDIIDETNKTTTKLFSAKSKCSYGYLMPKIYEKTIYATMNFTELSFNEIDSPMKKLDEKDVEKLQTILSTVFEEVLNGFLSVGFPVPLVDDVTLVDSSLQLLPRFIYVSSNYTFALEN